MASMPHENMPRCMVAAMPRCMPMPATAHQGARRVTMRTAPSSMAMVNHAPAFQTGMRAAAATGSRRPDMGSLRIR